MALVIRDVEELKKRARRLAAGQVLAGGGADLNVKLGEAGATLVSVAAGYGALSRAPELMPADCLIWILDGHAEIHEASGKMSRISQGKSTVLSGGRAYRLVFPTLTLYLRVEGREGG